MTTPAQRTYDQVVWALFEAVASGPHGPHDAIRTLLDRESVGAKMLGWTEASHRLEAQAAKWRAKKRTCPWCGGPNPCPTVT